MNSYLDTVVYIDILMFPTNAKEILQFAILCLCSKQILITSLFEGAHNYTSVITSSVPPSNIR